MDQHRTPQFRSEPSELHCKIEVGLPGRKYYRYEPDVIVFPFAEPRGDRRQRSSRFPRPTRMRGSGQARGPYDLTALVF